MSLQTTIHKRMIEAVKSKDGDGKNIYRFLKGQLDQFKEQPVSDAAAIKFFRTILNDAKGPHTSFKPREISLLRELVPPTLDSDATRSFLVDNKVADQIKDCPREGQAVGIAMKAFAQGKRSVDADIVRQVVLSLRA